MPKNKMKKLAAISPQHHAHSSLIAQMPAPIDITVETKINNATEPVFTL